MGPLSGPRLGRSSWGGEHPPPTPITAPGCSCGPQSARADLCEAEISAATCLRRISAGRDKRPPHQATGTTGRVKSSDGHPRISSRSPGSLSQVLRVVLAVETGGLLVATVSVLRAASISGARLHRGWSRSMPPKVLQSKIEVPFSLRQVCPRKDGA
ncbi:hypothetical protein NDU88_000872 [Pleurodeles waltl]|uniref:Uncharacterized protein n=1 Tax=Pleurodeles waltl TaxID=8319 RepID=A0AAV7LBD7_PLEWA|nr:hypothetical protein NDU88_000872 [Pleurodeles waltl]